MLIRAHTAKAKRSNRWLLCWAVLCQLLLPLSSTAAMSTATEGSPYYCGQMSSPLIQQIKAMDLPAELLAQLLPAEELQLCDSCLSSQIDPDGQLTTNRLAVSAELVRVLLEQPATQASDYSAAFFLARAPPQ